MRVGGWQKTSLLDFPGRVASLIFTQGCNFHCPYCHNASLVRGEGKSLPLATIFDTLRARRAVLQGVAVSGGEPTLHDDLSDFLREVRALGFAVKLDTNGSRPDVLAALLDANLVDYVALDVKSLPGAYDAALCAPAFNDAVPRSLALLGAADIPAECRVTAATPFVTVDNFAAIIEAVPARLPVFVQEVRLSGGVLDNAFLKAHPPLSLPELTRLCETAVRAGRACRLRA